MSEPLILLSAGGTGGHLFPAESLAIALRARGARVVLATDARVGALSGALDVELGDPRPVVGELERLPGTAAAHGLTLPTRPRPRPKHC